MKTLKQLKDEAYNRPEQYPFERLGKLLQWAIVTLKQNEQNTTPAN